MFENLLTIDSLVTFLILTALETVLGFDNLLYISIEAKKVDPAREAWVRRTGIILAIALRIVLLFVVLKLIDMFQASQILANDELWMDSATVLVSRARPRLFDSLGEEHVRQIMKLTSVISCKPGEVVTRQGETSDDMFLIVSGNFEASAPGTRGRALGEGDLFGELEHLSLKPRSENVSALGAGHIAAFKAEALFHWMRRNPEPGVTLAVNLARLLAARIAA